ncbi:MAG: outer membrane beta-barrel protein [Bacteroidota bacterium]|nr:outer membrane beta-barrel protein [Bacteroidota bacterium]MDP4216134.1 outer membrane beta-barrel protein [Bacteroidota bacterium]MDP4246426.1 outer membrane beta-barrel protein [Bacteroidota bacterium]MDP4253558.1 outer membrane beta-barrel protein [Bacteroidota bacterium]MDP4258578.1 outer membrane beta-barrel protein [Bacteroidota bacterium]
MCKRMSALFGLFLVVYQGYGQDAAPAKKDTAPALSITGSADFYYRYAFNRAASGMTSFTRTHDQFTLGMATVKLEHKTAKLDMVADLGFGPRALEFAYNDQGIVQAIKQLYISYSPNAWVKFTGGTWATHIGYEVLDAYANRNYSMSYMFTNGPFSHTGVRADFTVGKSGFMIGIANPTDFRSVPAPGKENKNMIAQYSYAPSDHFHLYLNYVGGQDPADNKIHQYDLVATMKANSLFSVGLNGTYNHSGFSSDNYAAGHNWYGAAAYFNLDPAPWFGLTLREEYFSDKDAVKTPGGSVIASTLSANFKVDGFIFIPEFRLDAANNPWYPKRDGTNSKSDASLLLAAIYSF